MPPKAQSLIFVVIQKVKKRSRRATELEPIDCGSLSIPARRHLYSRRQAGFLHQKAGKVLECRSSWIAQATVLS